MSDHPRAGREDVLHVTLVNRLPEIERLAELVERFCHEHGLADVAFAINLALDELITNVILYAYPDGREHGIDVQLRLEPGVLRVTVVDDGRAFDPRQVPAPDLDAPIDERPIGGLGLHLVRNMMDTIDYRREHDRNVLVLTKRLE